MRFFLIALLFLAGTASARANDLLIVSEEFPPYNYSQDGEARGLSTEVVQAVLEELGIDAEIAFLPWARSYLTAQSRKNTLIYSIGRIPEREDLFEWVGAIAPYNTSFYKLATNLSVSVTTLEDARPYRIGVSVEDVIYQYLEGQGFRNLEIVGEDLLNIRKLALGRVQLIAFDEASFAYRVGLEKMNPLLFERVHRIEALSGDLFMAFSKNSDPELVARFRQALATVKANGTYDAILLRYQLIN